MKNQPATNLNKITKFENEGGRFENVEPNPKKNVMFQAKAALRHFVFFFTWGERPVQRPDVCFWFYETGVGSVVSLDLAVHF